MNLEWWRERQQHIQEGQQELRHPGCFVPRWWEMRLYNFQKWVNAQLNDESQTWTKLAEDKALFWHMYGSYIPRRGEIFIKVPCSNHDTQTQSQEE